MLAVTYSLTAFVAILGAICLPLESLKEVNDVDALFFRLRGSLERQVYLSYRAT